ncbi:PglZ domain-containing protein [Anabaena sp. UHCC 0253]|uniref:PglZ domain-containing protein n=1 Tax=Anabaena sp. UHCC 0253 TaxID=2590019 RepID=UPI0014488A60|nr:PglZ domain-containing protein [Anabaena sp. UHCC 0253]MTJ52019.1 PglZ domain-containing protein [Anabaena sp. UHCC 0253]
MSKIILDPTGLYQPLSDYLVITTEVEWVRYFTLKNDNYWIKGKTLCNWTEEWLRVWNKSDLIIERKQVPRQRLTTIFSPLSIPDDWDDQYILKLATQFDNYPSNHPLNSLLADITNTEEDFWLIDNLSIGHLAKWLCVQVPQDYQIFEDVWKHKISQNHNHDHLLSYYQTENKNQLLKNWLGLSSDCQITNILGQYPLDIPDFCLEEFRKFWEQKIYQTEAKILDGLILPQESGNKVISSIAYDILLDKSIWINTERFIKISPYLGSTEKSKLEQKLPLPQPLSLSINATPEDTLKWVTESYLPFRCWETTINNTPREQQISEQLADSFVNWIVKYYPELKIDNVENSCLNYSVAFQVQELAKDNPILWIVVDGLGWLDHQQLIAILTKNNQLSLETDMKPYFSILPTKTEYAKWSLYSQLLPEHSSWTPNAKDGFSMVKSGNRYTDNNKHELNQDLKENKYQIYCWDTDQLDELYHQEKDWNTLYKVERVNRLEGIARNIQHYLEEYNSSEELKIVIASDHGQMMGEVQKLSNCPAELKSKGRMGIGKTDDPRFVVLEARRFGLPHDISIVRNSDCISAFFYTKDKEIIGSHGGLFPEEVVVGFSVLSKSLKRYPVIVTCSGEGKPKQPGELIITIHNHNLASLTHLSLYINELREFKTGKILDITIKPHDKITHKIFISEYPELPPHKNETTIKLSGKLTFLFANNHSGESNIDSESFISIQQIFSSGFQGDLDDF